MSAATRDVAVDVRGFSSFEKNTVVEVLDEEEQHDVEYGKHKIATFVVRQSDNLRVTGRVRLPEHVAKTSPGSMYVALYSGMVEGKNGKTYNDVTTLKPKVEGVMTAEKLQQFADELRSLDERTLNMKMKVQTLETFDAGAVFVYSDMEKRKTRVGAEEAMVVSYETELADGRHVTGRMYVPVRCEQAMKRCGDVGVLVYRGKRESTRVPGRFYYDISVVQAPVLENI